MSMVRLFAWSVLLLVLTVPVHSQEIAPWEGSLTIVLPKPVVPHGEKLTVELGTSRGNGVPIDQRGATFLALPIRYNYHSDSIVSIPATRQGARSFSLDPSQLLPGWYLLLAIADDDKGAPQSYGATFASSDAAMRAYAETAIFGVAGDPAEPQILIHTDRSRSVFAVGENVAIHLSAKAGNERELACELQLVSKDGQATPLVLAHAKLNLKPGTTNTQSYFINTTAIAPGHYELTLDSSGKIIDRYPIQIVPSMPSNPEARFFHSLQYDNRSGLRSSPVMPWERTMDEGWMKQIAPANLWINMGAGGVPIVAEKQLLPGAELAGMPPLEPFFRPAQAYARPEMLLARGISYGVQSGWTEAGSENYMPIPTIIEDQMQLVARQYLVGAMSLSAFPNFNGIYTDIYSKPDWHGGEPGDEQDQQIREALFAAAIKAAGATQNVPPPKNYSFTGKLPQSLSKEPTAKLYSEKAKEYIDQNYEGKTDLLEDATAAERAKAWEEIWKATGATTIPEAPTSYPFPRPNNVDLSSAPPDADLRYTAFVQQGIGRSYKAVTDTVESLFPSVFTLHNRRRENHRDAGYSFRDWTRGPSVPPEYSRGASVVFSSEWNLDSEPQPYLGPTQYKHTLVDDGHPVWATAVHARNGGQQRFLRDAIYLSGKGISPVFEDPGNASWSFKGADQSSFAAYDRLHAATEFLNYYENLFKQLEPIKELAIYLGPYWTDYNSYLAIPAAHMSGYQVGVLPYDDLIRGKAKQYPLLLSSWAPTPDLRPTEIEKLNEYTAGGGKIIASITASRYLAPEDPSKWGIKRETVSETDSKGRTKTRTTFTETMDQRIAMARDLTWAPLKDKVSFLPYDFSTRWAYIDETGTKVEYSSGLHWTKHQVAGNIAAPAREAAQLMISAFKPMLEPLVSKDQLEVFTTAMKPRDPSAKGWFLFISNFTVPKHEAWLKYRVPFMFWPTWCEPVPVNLSIKKEGVGAVYDIMEAKPVALREDNGRWAFATTLGSVEGRVFALYPSPVASAKLSCPSEVKENEMIAPQFQLLDASGNPMPVVGSVRIRLADASGRKLLELFRALPADGKLPSIHLPSNAAQPLTLTVLDTISGFEAKATVRSSAQPPKAELLPPVLVSHPQEIRAWLKSLQVPLTIVVDSGTDGKNPEANPALAQDQALAQSLKNALDALSIRSELVESKSATSGTLTRHPWENSTGRSNHTVPTTLIKGPVLFLGSPSGSPTMNQLERARISITPLGSPYSNNGRAVLSWAPRLFSIHDHTLLLAVSDEGGIAAAVAVIKQLISGEPDTKVSAHSIEAVRSSMAPQAINQFKAKQGVAIPKPTQALAANTQNSSAAPSGWSGLAPALASHVFGINASDGGVAVATTSLVKPVILLGQDGAIKRSFGGGGRLWPRDVAVSKNGEILIAGFALDGTTAAYKTDGTELWNTPSGILYKTAPEGSNLMQQIKASLSWDTFKDSERFLAISPDRSIVVFSANSDFEARDANTGTVLWRHKNNVKSDRERGKPFAEISFSPDGQFVLIYNLLPGAPDEEGNPQTITNCFLVKAKTGEKVWEAPSNVSGWEMYATVGPQAKWTITAARGSTFALRDETGTVLRVLEPRHLPESIRREAGPHGLMAPIFRVGSNPERMLLAKPETKGIYLIEIKIGSPEQRAQAKKADDENRAIIKTLEEKLQNTKEYKSYTNESVDAFLAPLNMPDDARRIIGDKMKKVPGELRAKRKRDFRYFKNELERVEKLLFEQDQALIEGATAVRVIREIPTPAIVSDAVINENCTTAYASLWDGTLRAYDLESGKELWKTELVGGCQLDWFGGHIYAGGSRGDVYKISAAKGSIIWQRNVSEAANQF